ncbi:MAG: hypothetical protein EPO68_09780 [Planctomycetota bacterium]|nr:MAG: hypothetical protein EPO68_09780 [Planctomycetota bacterium]
MGRAKTAVREPLLAWTWGALALASLAYALALVARGGWPLVAEAGAVAIASQPFGKFVVFAAWHENAPFGVWELGLLSALADVHVAFGLALLLGHARRAGRIGRWFDARCARARRMLTEYPGVRRLAFTGIVVFIALPFGTGPLVGTCVARLLGFSRLRGAVAVSVGTTVTSALFCGVAAALGAEGEALLKNPWLALGVSAALGAVLFALWLAARRALRSPARASRDARTR